LKYFLTIIYSFICHYDISRSFTIIIRMAHIIMANK
jgi:hypothetical protein